MGLGRLPTGDKLRNKIVSTFSDNELAEIDKQMKSRGFSSRSEFMHSCVMTAVKGELYVRND